MSDSPSNLRILALGASRPLAERVAVECGTTLVGSRETWFSCGEAKLEILENVRGADLYIFQSVIAPHDARSVYERFVMLLHAVDASVLADAESVTVVTPYYPCARQDKRKDRTREGVSAALVARCLQEAGARRVVALEIHNDAIAGMFHPIRCSLENIFLYPELGPWLTAQGLCGDIVVSPDVGGLERARHYAEDLAEGLAVCSKVRDYRTPNHVVQSTLIGDVDGKDVLLVDDIIDTAGSVVAAVQELKAGGARNVVVACAHPVLSGPAWARLAELHERAHREGWRFSVVGTSSVEHRNTPAWYTSYDIAPLLGRVIRSLHTRTSVTGAHKPS